MAAPSVTLNNGEKIPVLGLGTWQGLDDPGVVEQAVKDAIDAGYRHFDCAMKYGNEDVIGKAIREKISEGVVKREDLYIVTKLWNDKHKKKDVIETCKKSLENFGFDYIDLYLIHWPISVEEATGDLFSGKFVDIPLEETWEGMEECHRLGYTKSIGLSNFNSVQIDRILKVAKVKPVVNQVECHPNLNQKKLRDFCAARGIVITSYSPLGAPRRSWFKPGDPLVVIDEPEIVAIGKKYGKSPAQVVLRYLIDIGTVPIPKSSSKKRIQENINLFDFKLTPEEVATIDKFDIGVRVTPVEEFTGHPEYPFRIEF
ncbi:aldo-keto reductase family 1 member B1-like [Neodiprion pinetum]|uniref:Aldo-keto reductase family 1 member B1 isoform X3 n=1 Tax=Neodiprion lecontei TaxID=441921 RepID=A0ABM3GHW1_NEOLC|nr:aldo-keto reductase family 1 member B1-like isoform X3 [Neodiprion pinetum]XP_046599868.1 aldo-keto reductase family 1 member B1 isoform X3 [Neodiprion lecontei]